jgi:hypothetical protein
MEAQTGKLMQMTHSNDVASDTPKRISSFLKPAAQNSGY